MNGYSDIITLPHYRSKTRKHMTNTERAAQFAPFAALTGFDGDIGEAARLTGERREPTEEETDRLNEQMRLICERIGERPSVRVVYFIPDEKKSGGRYAEIYACVRHIDIYENRLIFTDGGSVGIRDIFELELL